MPTIQRAVQDSVRLSTWLWAALLALIALAGCSQTNAIDGSGGAPGRGIYVEADWSRARRVTGHRVHVEERRIACNACHELNATAIGAVSPIRCAACHAGQATIQHAAGSARQRFGPAVQADCVNCHAFTGANTAPGAVDDRSASALESYRPGECARCHDKTQGTLPAVTVHAATACLNCHRPHLDAKPISAECVNCHRGVSTTHASRGKTPSEACRGCHSHQHAPASDALASCVECHSRQEPVVAATALFSGGHRACVDCHRPHEFATKQAVACRSCHAQVLVLAEDKVAAHASCTSCHQPHDVRKSAAASCKSCHWDVHSDHPERAGVGSCVSCHDAHPARAVAATVARACSSCHEQAASDHAFHQGASCQGCHTPHHFKVALAQHAPCEGCHQNEVRLSALRTGHTACESCHSGLPHNPRVGSGVCTTCHSAAHHDANAGHQNCVGCHEPHSGAVASSCKSCHQQEFATAPAGHQACIGCHQPHSGASKRVQCVTCHESKAESRHGALASGCLGCHRPHGPGGTATPPACTTCHAIASLPGLHARPEHQACARCHGGHGDSADSSRNACLTCHADRRKHFPDAPRCANCHLFQAPEHGLKAH